MLSPYLVLKSAVGAVQDRHFIGKNSNKKLSSIDAAYYNKMVAETGQSTHNPITYFKNLKKAYNVNVDRFELVAQANAPIRLIKDSEIIHSLKEFCEENKITAGIIQGIGALNSLTLGYFNSATKEYKEKTIQGSIEMTSLMGNISIKDSQTYLHCHVTASNDDYNTIGGHLISATISLTGEIFITALDGKIGRYLDNETGLNLFKF